MVALHNLGSEPVQVSIRLDDCPPGTRLADLLRDGEADVDDLGWSEVELGRYGHRWLRVVAPRDRRLL
jgi:hypothetical protein